MGTFLGTGGEQRVAEVGLGGVAFRLISFSSKFQTSGLPGRDKTVAGRSATMSSSLVSFSGGSLSMTSDFRCCPLVGEIVAVDGCDGDDGDVSFVGDDLLEELPSRRIDLASDRMSISFLTSLESAAPVPGRLPADEVALETRLPFPLKHSMPCSPRKEEQTRLEQ